MNNKFMLAALDEAEKAICNDEVPIGAVIVRNDKIISTGYNTKEINQNVLCHAELLAIEKASKTLNNWRLDGCDIYITLEPCPMCASAIKQARIDRIFFGLRNSDKNNMLVIKQILASDKLNRKVELYGGYYQNEIKNHMKKFFIKKRNK